MTWEFPPRRGGKGGAATDVEPGGMRGRNVEYSLDPAADRAARAGP